MNRVKVWKPFLQLKLIEKVNKIPIFSRMLNKFLDKIRIIRNEAWANVRCVCCGGFLSSGRRHLYFEWACIPSDTGEKCEYLGRDGPRCYTLNPNCVLREDKEVIEKRKYFYKVIRSEILEIFRRYGVCIVDEENEEVKSSLAEIWNDFTIYGFRGKGNRCNVYKEGDEMVYKREEVDTIFLILYPNISYRLLEAKIKLMNTDVEELEFLRMLKTNKKHEEA